MHPASSTNTNHDVTNLLDHKMAKIEKREHLENGI